MSEIASYQPLVDAFAVCGLASGEPLSTITGEAGYQGTDARYRPSVTDSLASPRTQHGPVERGAKLPTHFAMCCMPGGVEILLHSSSFELPQPKVYSVVLTEEDGTRLYVACLAYFEDLPPTLACQHSVLLGAHASRALCLVSHQPYLASMERMLLRLHAAIFITGPIAPVGDLLALLTRIPCPHLGTQPMPTTTSATAPSTAAAGPAAAAAAAAGGTAAVGSQGSVADGAAANDLQGQGMGEGEEPGMGVGGGEEAEAGGLLGGVGPQAGGDGQARLAVQVRFDMEGTRFVLHPPNVATGLPVEELPLRPLLQTLSVDNLLLLFLAVLLERRVLLRASRLRLLTQTAEALRQLLYPFRFLHTYIPVMPSVLVDYVEAPTPYLMGLHSSAELESRALDQVVVVDLDRNEVVTRNDPIHLHLPHPSLSRLRLRLSPLLACASSDTPPLQPQPPTPSSTITLQTAAPPTSHPSQPTPTLQHQGHALHTHSLNRTSPTVNTNHWASPDLGRTNSHSSVGGQGGGYSGGGHGARLSRPSYAASYAPTESGGHDWDADAGGGDVWASRAAELARIGWSGYHEHLVRRLFLQCMSGLLKGFHNFLPSKQNSTAGPHPGLPHSQSGNANMFAQTSHGPNHLAVQHSPGSMNKASSPLAVGMRTTSFSSGLSPLQMVARDNSASSGGTGIGPQISIGEAGSSHTSSSGRTNLPFDSQGFVAWHERVNKVGGNLLSQVTQTLSFYNFVEEWAPKPKTKPGGGKAQTFTDPYGWHRLASSSFLWQIPKGVAAAATTSGVSHSSASPSSSAAMVDPQLMHALKLCQQQQTPQQQQAQQLPARQQAQPQVVVHEVQACKPSPLKPSKLLPYRLFPPLLTAKEHPLEPLLCSIPRPPPPQKLDSCSPEVASWAANAAQRSRLSQWQSRVRRGGGGPYRTTGKRSLSGDLSEVKARQRPIATHTRAATDNLCIPNSPPRPTTAPTTAAAATAGGAPLPPSRDAYALGHLSARTAGAWGPMINLDGCADSSASCESSSNAPSCASRPSTPSGLGSGAAMVRPPSLNRAHQLQTPPSITKDFSKQGMLSMYSAEADLMRHQTVIVLQLLAYPIHDPMPLELEERARLMLRIQLGGNGMFILSRLREELSCQVPLRSSKPGGNAEEGAGEKTPVAPAAKKPKSERPHGPLRERVLHSYSFEVLADMLGAIIQAAVVEDDHSSIVSALEVAAVLVCASPGSAHKDRIIHHLGSIQPLLYSAPIWCNILAHMLSSASSAASAAEAAKATLTANAATAAAAAKAMAVVAAEAATAQHMADSAADKATADEATADKATAYLSAGLSGGQASSPPAAVHSMQVGGEVMTATSQLQSTANISNKSRGQRSIRNSVGARSIGATRGLQRGAMEQNAYTRNASNLPSPKSASGQASPKASSTTYTLARHSRNAHRGGGSYSANNSGRLMHHTAPNARSLLNPAGSKSGAARLANDSMLALGANSDGRDGGDASHMEGHAYGHALPGLPPRPQLAPPSNEVSKNKHNGSGRLQQRRAGGRARPLNQRAPQGLSVDVAVTEGHAHTGEKWEGRNTPKGYAARAALSPKIGEGVRSGNPHRLSEGGSHVDRLPLPSLNLPPHIGHPYPVGTPILMLPAHPTGNNTSSGDAHHHHHHQNHHLSSPSGPHFELAGTGRRLNTKDALHRAEGATHPNAPTKVQQQQQQQQQQVLLLQNTDVASPLLPPWLHPHNNFINNKLCIPPSLVLHCGAALGALRHAGCALMALGAKDKSVWALLQAVACQYLSDLVAQPPAAASTGSIHGCASPYLPQPPDPTNLHSCTRSNRVHVAEALSELRAAVQQAHTCSHSARLARQPDSHDGPPVYSTLLQAAGGQQPAAVAPAPDIPTPSPRGARPHAAGTPPLPRQSLPGGMTSHGYSIPLPWVQPSGGGGGNGIGSAGNVSGGGWGRGMSGQVGGEGRRLSGRASGYAAAAWASAPNSPRLGGAPLGGAGPGGARDNGGSAAQGGYVVGAASMFSALGLAGDLPGRGLQRRGFFAQKIGERKSRGQVPELAHEEVRGPPKAPHGTRHSAAPTSRKPSTRTSLANRPPWQDLGPGARRQVPPPPAPTSSNASTSTSRRSSRLARPPPLFLPSNSPRPRAPTPTTSTADHKLPTAMPSSRPPFPHPILDSLGTPHTLSSGSPHPGSAHSPFTRTLTTLAISAANDDANHRGHALHRGKRGSSSGPEAHPILTDSLTSPVKTTSPDVPAKPGGGKSDRLGSHPIPMASFPTALTSQPDPVHSTRSSLNPTPSTHRPFPHPSSHSFTASARPPHVQPSSQSFTTSHLPRPSTRLELDLQQKQQQQQQQQQHKHGLADLAPPQQQAIRALTGSFTAGQRAAIAAALLRHSSPSFTAAASAATKPPSQSTPHTSPSFATAPAAAKPPSQPAPRTSSFTAAASAAAKPPSQPAPRTSSSFTAATAVTAANLPPPASYYTTSSFTAVAPHPGDTRPLPLTASGTHTRERPATAAPGSQPSTDPHCIASKQQHTHASPPLPYSAAAQPFSGSSGSATPAAVGPQSVPTSAEPHTSFFSIPHPGAHPSSSNSRSGRTSSELNTRPSNEFLPHPALPLPPSFLSSAAAAAAAADPYLSSSFSALGSRPGSQQILAALYAKKDSVQAYKIAASSFSSAAAAAPASHAASAAPARQHSAAFSAYSDDGFEGEGGALHGEGSIPMHEGPESYTTAEALRTPPKDTTQPAHHASNTATTSYNYNNSTWSSAPPSDFSISSRPSVDGHAPGNQLPHHQHHPHTHPHQPSQHHHTQHHQAQHHTGMQQAGSTAAAAAAAGGGEGGSANEPPPATRAVLTSLIQRVQAEEKEGSSQEHAGSPLRRVLGVLFRAGGAWSKPLAPAATASPPREQPPVHEQQQHALLPPPHEVTSEDGPVSQGGKPTSEQGASGSKDEQHQPGSYGRSLSAGDGHQGRPSRESLAGEDDTWRGGWMEGSGGAMEGTSISFARRPHATGLVAHSTLDHGAVLDSRTRGTPAQSAHASHIAADQGGAHAGLTSHSSMGPGARGAGKGSNSGGLEMDRDYSRARRCGMLQTARLVHQQKAPVMGLAATAGVVLAGGPGPRARMLLIKDGRLLPWARIPLPPRCGGSAFIRMSANAGLAAIGGARDSSISMVDLTAGRVASQLQPCHTTRLTQLLLGPTGSLLLSASTDDLVRLWDVRCCTASSAKAISVRSSGSSLGGFGAPGGGAVASMETGHCGTTALLLDGGRMQAYTGGRDGCVCAWDLRNLTSPLARMQGHTGPITTLRLTRLPLPDSAASAPADSGSGTAYAQGDSDAHHGGGAHGVHAASSSMPCVISASHDWTVRVWDVGGSSASMGGCCAVLQGHAGPVHALHVVQPPARRDQDHARVWHAAAADAAGGAAPAGEGVSEGGSAADEAGGQGAGGCTGRRGGSEGRGSLMGSPLLVSGGGDGALGVWDLCAAVAQPPPPLLRQTLGTGGAATWDGASAAGGALPGCVWMQRVHGRGVCLLEEGTAAVGLAGGVSRDAWAEQVGGGLVLSGAEDGSMGAWRVQLPGWGCPALAPAKMLPTPAMAALGGGCAAGKGGGEVVQHWSPHAAYQASQTSLAGAVSPVQLQQQQPLQCLGWQAARAASTCMALDPMTGVVVSGGHDGQLRAWAPFAG